MKQLLISFYFIFLFTQSTFSSHLYGTELTYTCAGNDNYTFKLTVYRDCAAISIGPITPFDASAYFTIFTGDGNLYENKPAQSYYSADYNSSNNTLVSVQLSNPCLIPPMNTCSEATYYEFTVNLPFNSLGYHIVQERCCRDNNVVNLLNSGTTGMTTSIFLSKKAQQFCNNSPTFNEYSNYFFCINETTEADFSAIDLDGDSLVYLLCVPNSGGSPFDPKPQNVSNPPPFPTATYVNGFSPTQPISGLFSINSNTGIVTASPTANGIYAIAVCVDEYRNGVWLSSVKRDIQIIIEHCGRSLHAAIACDSISPDGNFHVSTCNNSYEFSNQSGQAQYIDDFLWQFNSNNITSTSQNPIIFFPDSAGIYTGQLIVNPNSITCSDTANIIVHLHSRDSLKVDFLHTYDSTLYDPIAFQSLAQNSTAPIKKWIWSFGDNYDSELINPVHYYPDSGIYTVKHTVIDSVGCFKSIIKEVEWYPLPILLNNENKLSNIDVKLYPNPVNDFLNLEIDENDFEKEMSILIYNSIGKEMAEMKNLNTNIIQIPIHQFENGYYFLKIKHSERFLIVKFIVQK